MQDELKQTAERFIEESGLSERVLKAFRDGIVMCSEEPNGSLRTATEEQMGHVQDIEKDGNVIVWHIISGTYQYPDGIKQVTTYLIVRYGFFGIRRAGRHFLSHNYTLFSENGNGNFGDAILAKTDYGLRRIA